ncbi:PRD domain-containing protein [Konateibacter massiliensis]|uniref:PRD domain-containing protein n=1 Tax=Konateibacter massiliensis TaxID=2002841 RepID=UPI000C15192F|nr:PRD domain-containing protein [Konateibacter massiliensis]
MELIKALNNNIALVKNENNQEEVVMGSGVSFKVHSGEQINEALVEKRFVLDGNGKKKAFENLLDRIRVDDVELASNIIKDGENQLGYQCRDSIILTLSDHLGMMLERAKDGLYFTSPLQWDIQLIYPKEYRYSEKVIEKLRKKTGYEIPNQEAAFIALHFINSRFDGSGMNETVLCTKIIQNILNITRVYYGREFHEDDFNVSRFITHIQYFVRRQVSGQKLTADITMAEMIGKQCPKDYKCALKIAEFLKHNYQWDVTDGEKLYLTLHLNRINVNEKN